MDFFLKDIVIELEKIFKKNLICVLLIGSVLKSEQNPFSDIDLVAIIISFQMKQMHQIRDFVKNQKKFLDLSFLGINEISSDSDKFQIGTHGCYQLELILKNAKCLYGTNILAEKKSPSQKAINESIIVKIGQYAWWARRMFIESNRERSIESNYQLNSRLIKMIRDLMYLSGFKNIHARSSVVVKKFIIKYSNILLEEEKNELEKIVDYKKINELISDMSEEYFSIRISIINKIQEIGISFLS